ncbi:MAG TPA: penicillin-binding protein 2 [Candidatus Paceibacterota bacterium]|nr:penicillin-binding protein 2 [Candidatus Paceibacterota bacterium]
MSILPNQARIKLIGVLVCAAALIIVARLYYIQIIRHSAYAAQAEKQYVQQGQALFDRGTIYFSPLDSAPISAATIASGYAVTLQPKKAVHPEDIVNALSGVLTTDPSTGKPIDENFLTSKLATTSSYTEIAHRVDEATAERIESLNIAGLGDYKEQWRYYPAGKLASNVLGFVGYNDSGTELTGRYGLEKSYNDVLSRGASDTYVNFFAEIFSNVSDNFIRNDAEEGDIVTTIEPTVQQELEKQLASVMSVWHSDLTGGIIMNPYTGEIYAMAMNPDFDPNNFAKEKDQSVFKNPLVDGVYEMGSIVKPLVMAAGLDQGVVTPDTQYDDTGYVIVNGAKVSNYDGRARGVITMQRVLDESLNVGMAFVARKLGNDEVTKYLTNYGLGEETGIDLPGEVHGQIGNLKSARELEHVTASFGQGIAITPIETIRALSSLGNGGFLPNPHIVKRIDYTSGDSKTPSYDNVKQVIKPETSETITRMLVQVVDTALLNGTVKFPHYTVAAKTGTAQMASPQGGYYSDRYLHSFFGYFPAYKPQFIIFLFTVYPKGAEYASHTLTMPFIDLAKFLINYYEVPPDR